MKKMMKRAGALLLVLALSAGLSACGGGLSEDSAKIYVQGLIDENYLGKCTKEFMKLVDIDEERVQEIYEGSIETEVEFFLDNYVIDYPTDEMKEELKEIYKEIYQHTKVEVVSAAKQGDDSYSVKVNVEPINIAYLAEEQINAALDSYYEKYANMDPTTMTEEEYQAMDADWAEIMISAYRDNLSKIENMEVKSISVQLEKDSDGYYSITEDDFARLDALIIDYNVPQTDL